MKAVVAAFNQEKALVGAFSVITNLREDHRFKLQFRPTLNSSRQLNTSFTSQLSSKRDSSLLLGPDYDEDLYSNEVELSTPLRDMIFLLTKQTI